jgi:prephenate dehydrogenase
MQLRQLSILGVGLLGGSLGLACRALSSTCRIVGYGHRRSTLDTAEEVGAIDQGFDNLADAVRGAELVILCTPVGRFQQILREMAGHLAPGTIVTDVGSTKRSVVRVARKLLPRHVRFVGSHPMAGSEKRGVEFARADLFQNAVCITTPTQDTDRGALGDVEAFWGSLGMRTTRLSPVEHDRVLADVSHLPHVLAAALVSMQLDRALPLAGKGFLDTTRIAGGDGALWRDILLDNRDNLRRSIGRLRKQLDRLAALLEPDNADALVAYLNAAASRRADLLRQKLAEVTPD